MTKIITTIGPSSGDLDTLKFFASKGVAIARLNFSHNTSEWHGQTAQVAREAGLKVLFDLPGPKIRLGELSEAVNIENGDSVILEHVNPKKTYPYSESKKSEVKVFPCAFEIHKFVNPGQVIVIDDGKLQITVEKNDGKQVVCRVDYGGVVKSRKSLNMPGAKIEVPFLGERDRSMLSDLLVSVKPDYVASSFVKTKAEIDELKNFIDDLLKQGGVSNYYPKICTKIEMAEAVEVQNLDQIVQASDMIMIARGDLALETTPLHLSTPFLQEKIKRTCKLYKKPFIVATQVLESMIESPVPTRAEVSDLYRAVVLDKANYVMLSGETAYGQYPIKAVEIMSGLIEQREVLNAKYGLNTPRLSLPGFRKIIQGGFRGLFNL